MLIIRVNERPPASLKCTEGKLLPTRIQKYNNDKTISNIIRKKMKECKTNSILVLDQKENNLLSH